MRQGNGIPGGGDEGTGGPFPIGRGALDEVGGSTWTSALQGAVKMDVMCNMHVRDARADGRERSEDHLHVPAVATLQVQDLILALSEHHEGGSFPTARIAVGFPQACQAILHVLQTQSFVHHVHLQPTPAENAVRVLGEVSLLAQRTQHLHAFGNARGGFVFPSWKPTFQFCIAFVQARFDGNHEIQVVLLAHVGDGLVPITSLRRFPASSVLQFFHDHIPGRLFRRLSFRTHGFCSSFAQTCHAPVPHLRVHAVASATNATLRSFHRLSDTYLLLPGVRITLIFRRTSCGASTRATRAIASRHVHRHRQRRTVSAWKPRPVRRHDEGIGKQTPSFDVPRSVRSVRWHGCDGTFGGVGIDCAARRIGRGTRFHASQRCVEAGDKLACGREDAWIEDRSCVLRCGEKRSRGRIRRSRRGGCTVHDDRRASWTCAHLHASPSSLPGDRPSHRYLCKGCDAKGVVIDIFEAMRSNGCWREAETTSHRSEVPRCRSPSDKWSRRFERSTRRRRGSSRSSMPSWCRA